MNSMQPTPDIQYPAREASLSRRPSVRGIALSIEVREYDSK